VKRPPVLRVRGKGGKVVFVPLPPAVARAVDQAVDGRTDGPILRDTLGARMDRHAAIRRLKHLAEAAGIRMPRMHLHMLRHTFVTTMLDAKPFTSRSPHGYTIFRILFCRNVRGGWFGANGDGQFTGSGWRGLGEVATAGTITSARRSISMCSMIGNSRLPVGRKK
jgi:hypothetical protein